MKIIHIVPAAPFGGAQKVARDLAWAQAKAGLDVAMVLTGGRELGVTYAAIDGVDTRFVSGTVPKKLLGLRRVFRDLAPDIVHIHMAPPWVMPLLPYRSSIIVVHLHTIFQRPKGLKSRLGSLMQSIVLRRADVLLPVSRWVERQWRPLYPNSRFELVFNGIRAPDGEAGVSSERRSTNPRVGFASRLAEDKGVEEFADFAKAFHKLCPDVEFLIAGDGPMLAFLEESISNLAPTGCVRFLGFVEDMTWYWSQIDLAVVCAEKEPFGLRLIEPVAHGVPVVAYRTGAGSDEIIDLCLAVEAVPYGRHRELASLAASILSDNIRREAMVEEGKEQVQAHFSLEAMARNVEQAYITARDRRGLSRR